jgi:thioredoxin 1
MNRHLARLVRAALLAGLAACASAPAQPQSAMMPAPASTPAAPAALPAPPARSAPAADEQFQLVNASGELVPVEQVLVTGKVTIVDFYADWCGPCKVLDQRLRAELQTEPRIAVRKIDVGRAEARAVTDRYGIRNLPHVRIYGTDGRLLHDLVGAQAQQTGRLALDALTSL